MRNRYFFDKLDVKHFVLKYGIMLLVALPFLVLVNILNEKYMHIKSMILIDLLVILVVVLVGELIYRAIKNKRENKED